MENNAKMQELKEKFQSFWQSFKTKVVELWGKRNDNVKPVIAWSVYGGVLAVAVVLALIFWL